jgi:protein disulfide-isomerase A6
MPSLNPLVKEFLNAADDKRKEVLSKIEEDVAKLSSFAAKYFLPPSPTLCLQAT